MGGKKSTVVPVEQFKTFSVYEDHNENVEQQQLVAAINKQNDAVTSQDVVDKENVFHEKQQRLQQQQQHHNILSERRWVTRSHFYF